MSLKLQTEVKIPKAPFRVVAGGNILIIGSCFAENIGSKLELIDGLEARVYCNPSGVVYNPLSVAIACENFRYGRKFSQSELREHNKLWHSMLHHGKFSASTPQEVLTKINRDAVEEIDYIVITLGTAFVYFMEGEVVSNCHKIPEREFSRRKISVQECVDALQRVANCYPKAKIIVSLSPIRHLRDGLSENSLSKATLRVAIDKFCGENSQDRFYFPSYEILIDELRDYRFTAEDMCHPTTQTKDYIWHRFSDTMLEDKLIEMVSSAIKEQRAAAHRPLR